VSTLVTKIEAELRSNILPFWMRYGIDEEFGGFRGRISNELVIDRLAEKGLILNARILWTFSRVYKVYGEQPFLDIARRAYAFIAKYFRDADHGGVYWMVDHRGVPTDTKKRIYGQAFTLYALAEYYRATKDETALAFAISQFELIEKYSYDAVNGGYFETFERDWTIARDQRLSDVDMDEKKSMNTHLHVMEGYAVLLQVWENGTLRNRLRELIEIFHRRILNEKNHHLLMFFDEKWQPKSDHISYGHDIEASWLMVEAAEALGDERLLEESKVEAVRMAQAVYNEGLDADGGLLYEADSTGLIDSDKHWWPQAEAVVGFLNAYEISEQVHFLKAAERSWEFIDARIVDHLNGEWFGKVSRDGEVRDGDFKVDEWKCPYHNSRACLEAIRRLTGLREKGQTI
jgi:mannobiose 2-epimerase